MQSTDLAGERRSGRLRVAVLGCRSDCSSRAIGGHTKATGRSRRTCHRSRPAAPPDPCPNRAGDAAGSEPGQSVQCAGANMLSPAVAGALTRVYVPNLRSNDVYVIDPASHSVIDRFQVGLLPAARDPVLGFADTVGRE